MRTHDVLQMCGVALACLFTAAGCGDGDRPPLAAVTGTVTFNGEPLPNAHLIFQPAASYRASYSLTNDRGEYEAIYLRDIRGAVIGNHTVRIDHLPPEENVTARRLPARYNDQTELQILVEPGNNSIDFDLHSH